MLQQEIQDRIVAFVKSEPRTVQEISQHLGKAWMTADKYCEEIARRTGQIRIKTFRKGTQGALKLVYTANTDAMPAADIEARIVEQLRGARFKHHFDFLEIYQCVPEHARTIRTEQLNAGPAPSQQLIERLESAQHTLLYFSGNLTLLTATIGKRKVIDTLRTLLSRGVHIKIICRITPGSQRNLKLLETLRAQYRDLIEIRHAYQPLRGFIVDENFARFKDEEKKSAYPAGELDHDLRIIYDITDEHWVRFLTNTFWRYWRGSIDAHERMRIIEQMD